MKRRDYNLGFAVPLIKRQRAGIAPWELYQRIYPKSSYSFFLDSLEYHPPAQRYSYVSWNPYARISYEEGKLHIEGETKRVEKTKKILPTLRKFFESIKVSPHFNPDFFTGGAVGYFGYELAQLFDRVHLRSKQGPSFPWLVLLCFRDLIVFDHKEKIYYLISWIVPKKRIPWKKALNRAKKQLKEIEKIFWSSNGKEHSKNFSLLQFRPGISKKVFEKMIRRAKSYIAAGDIYQANLSQRFSFKFKGSPLMLYDRLRKTNPSPYSAVLHLGDIFIASSSPELLAAKKGKVCVTCPIAGTRPRGRSQAETHRLECELLANEKEKAEHLMLVDLERNDLGRVSDWRSVHVKDFMRIEKYSRVIHIVSEVAGRLRSNKDAWDLIQTMFPGGTITGCPKIRSMEIIDELEPVERGIYTGSIGYVGFNGDLMLNIAIRTLVLLKNRGLLQVGAGIVADSDPAREYEETLHKGEALAEALLEASSVK